MVANFGYGALIIALLVSLYGIGAAFYGVRKNNQAWVSSARNAMLLTWPLVTLAALSIIYLLVTNHYEVEYVSSVTSNSMPFYLKVTALWGGQAGSLIFWSWLMSGFASAVTLRKWDRDREFLPWVIVVACVTLAFFIGMNVFFENPFQQFYQTPAGVEAFPGSVHAAALLRAAGYPERAVSSAQKPVLEIDAALLVHVAGRG